MPLKHPISMTRRRPTPAWMHLARAIGMFALVILVLMWILIRE